jgi:hypothetical protein
VSLIKSQSGSNILVFNDITHRYHLNGNAVPGATTFTKGGYPTGEGLISWMKGESAKYALDIGFQLGQVGEPLSETRKKEIIKEAKGKDKEAAETAAAIGTLVHDYAYHSELGHGEEVREILAVAGDHPDWQKIKNGIDKFEAWNKENKDELLMSETIVGSAVHQFGGKFDRLSKGFILDDFKTSNSIYIDHFNQLGAYAVALEEWMGISVKGLRVLRFGKEDGEFQPLLISDPEEIKAFKYQAILCRQTYKFRLKWEADKRFDWKRKK